MYLSSMQFAFGCLLRSLAAGLIFATAHMCCTRSEAAEKVVVGVTGPPTALGWPFEIAIATSSLKFRRRASVSAGGGSSRVEWTISAPHRRPFTMIGLPTDRRTPIRSRKYAAIGPETLS